MKQQDYKTVLVMVLGLLIIAIWREWTWLTYTSIGIGLAAVISNRILTLIVKGWFGLAKVLGYINSRILLTVVYVLILMPLAFLSRMFGNNSVQLKKKNGESYFETRNHKYVKADLENPW
ncbi:MAG: SxtJ family membrane protein [Cytophagales bacterium]|nr:SxtJ family membrane protein [Cytophagales bacterium]